MGMFDEYPPRIRAILEKVAAAGYSEVLLDEEAGNRFIFTSMAASNDPILQEIGEQLRDGAIDLGQLVNSDVYRDAIDGGLHTLSQLDTDQMTSDLNAATTGGGGADERTVAKQSSTDDTVTTSADRLGRARS